MDLSLLVRPHSAAKPQDASAFTAYDRAERERPTAPLLGLLELGLEQLGVGLVLMDRELQVVFSNAAGRSALARIHAAGDERPDDRLVSQWKRVLRDVRDSGRRALFEVREERDAEPQYAAVMPLAGGAAGAAGGAEPWLWVVFGSSAICGPLELQMFGAHCELTYSERQVLGSLCQGSRANEVAREHGVAISTIRTQLASLRAKVRASGIQDLICALSRLPRLQAPAQRPQGPAN